MFRTLIYPSSGACDYSVELPHWSYCSWFDVCWSCIHVAGWSSASACNMDTTPTQPHWNSNTHRTKNNTTNVVIQQNSRKLPMMDILMSETCWAHKKWNKIAGDIKLVFYSSTMYCILSTLWTAVCNFVCVYVCVNCYDLSCKTKNLLNLGTVSSCFCYTVVLSQHHPGECQQDSGRMSYHVWQSVIVMVKNTGVLLSISCSNCISTNSNHPKCQYLFIHQGTL